MVLSTLLTVLVEEGESFSPLRPLGNSGWRRELIESLGLRRANRQHSPWWVLGLAAARMGDSCDRGLIDAAHWVVNAHATRDAPEVARAVEVLRYQLNRAGEGV